MNRWASIAGMAGLLLSCTLTGASAPERQVIFLDNSPGLENGSNTYDPRTRHCNQGTDRVFTSLEHAAPPPWNVRLYVKLPCPDDIVS